MSSRQSSDLIIVSMFSLTTPLSRVGGRSIFPVIVPKSLWDRSNAVDSGSYVVATVFRSHHRVDVLSHHATVESRRTLHLPGDRPEIAMGPLERRRLRLLCRRDSLPISSSCRCSLSPRHCRESADAPSSR